jgi:hypothetical protein
MISAAGRSPSFTFCTAALSSLYDSSSSAPLSRSADTIGPSPTTAIFVLSAPTSRRIRPKITRNINGNRKVKNNVTLSRRNPLSIAIESVLNAFMRGTPGRSG